MAAFDREYAESAVEEFARRRRDGLPIPESMLRHACARIGRSRATVLRWVRRGAVSTYRERSGFRLTREHKAEVFAADGDCTLAFERLGEERKLGCGLRTFQRAVEFGMTARELAYAKDGARRAREFTLFLERQEEGRAICFEADHKQVDLFVLAPGRDEPVKPWITMFADSRWRQIKSIAVTIRPTQDDVLAAFGASLVDCPDLGSEGAVPHMLRIDRGMEFTADAVTDAGVMIGTQVVHTPPYTPNRKGKIERIFRTMKQELFARLPWFDEGPKKRSGALAVPKGVLPLSLEVFVVVLFDWAWHYNMERVHSVIGCPPTKGWMSDTTPLRMADPKKLRRHLLKSFGERKVSKRGVMVSRRWYTCAELEPLIGRKVEVRGLQHDRRSMEIFIGDEWIGTAYPHDEASPEEKERVLAARTKAAYEAAGLAKTAEAKKRRRYKAITAKAAPEETTSIPKSEADRLRDEYDDDTLRELGLSKRRGKKRNRRKRGDDK